MPNNTQETDSRSGHESYIHDYKSAHFKKVVGERTAAVHGAFFLPYLYSGMMLLDCGCGPGTISIGLAEAVTPGQVVGIDIEANQVDTAISKADKLSISNLRFETGNVYELAFGDNTFDAVFSHGLLAHMSEPVKALKEMHRVLKIGGIIGLRSGDWAGTIIAPTDSILESAIDLYLKFRQYNGGDPFTGRRLRALLREAGFVDTKASASYEYWGTTEATRSFLEVFLSELTGPKIVEQAIKLGWTDKSHFEKTAIVLKQWSEHPDSFFAFTWCEAVGWKK